MPGSRGDVERSGYKKMSVLVGKTIYADNVQLKQQMLELFCRLFQGFFWEPRCPELLFICVIFCAMLHTMTS